MPRLILIALCVAIILLLHSSPAHAADKLSDVLKEVGWDGIIGTWVDADTNGETVKVAYAWKLTDRVIEVTTQYSTEQGRQESVAFMAVNAKNGKVVHLGADSDGGTSLGEWNVDDIGDAILSLIFTSGDGQEGTLNVRHHMEDEDTMIVTIELSQPIDLKMVRAT